MKRLITSSLLFNCPVSFAQNKKMIKLYILIFLQITNSVLGYSQSTGVTDTGVIHKDYFELLFGNNFMTNNDGTIVKVGISEADIFFITTKGAVKQYFKRKFNINDSAAYKMDKIFLQADGKIPFSDTIIFSRIHLDILDFYPESILETYKKRKLLDFLNEYMPIPQAPPDNLMSVVLYEKRMFYELSNAFLSPYTTDFLMVEKKVYFNNATNKWEVMNKSE